MSPRSKKATSGKSAGPSRPLPLGVARGKPRVPLPKQTGGAHEDKTKRPWRRRKHKKLPHE
jgi:hypothetical protein